MRLTIYRLLVAIIAPIGVAVLGPISADAQHSTGEGPARWPRCGTYHMQRFDYAAAVRNTAEASPALYRQAVEESKGTSMKLMSADEATFWVPNYVTMQFDQLRAVRVHQGRLARIWIDVRDTARTTLKDRLPLLITALEDSTAPASRNPGKGIIENDIEVFGAAPTVVGDGFQDFLLYDIADQSILGFFMPTDQTTEEFSNRRNMLYIDSREGVMQVSSVLNTLAHEFQHLLHHGSNPNADLFINEGCSEVAGLMCGYTDRLNQNYLRNTNTMMFDFPNDDAGNMQAYERALTVIHYLYEQFGDAFLRELPKRTGYGMAVINEALSRSHPGDPRAHWDSAGRAFAIANWLQTSADPRYGYRVNLTHASQRRARHLRTYTQSSIRTQDSVTILPYGAVYLVYETPPALTIRVQGRYRYGVMALAYTGTDVEVMTFPQGSPIVIGTPGAITGYDRVVLILTEQSSSTQKITWQIGDGITSTGDESDLESGAMLSIVPNPASERSSVAITASGDGSLDLVLYSASGEAVRTVVDGERLARGSHRFDLDLTGLPAGAYLARMSEAGVVATRVVIVQ